MRITSPQFAEGEMIPAKYSCEGLDVNPTLEFHDIPAATKSLVVVVENYDVPKRFKADGIWDHWIVWNVAPTTTVIPEGTRSPVGVVGRNTTGDVRYEGPCPAEGEHQYYFKLFALDRLLDLPKAAPKTQVVAAMQGHIIAEAQLIGRYGKPEVVAVAATPEQGETAEHLTQAKS